MTAHTPEKLVYMANQIARNLALDPDPVGTLEQHIRAFWSPRMKDMAFALLDDAGTAFDPAAREALVRLARAYGAQAAG